MSRTKLAVLGIIVIFVGLTTAQTLYTVRETEQAIVLQFGKPIRVVSEPGLAYKLPFIQNVEVYDDRILDLDPAEVQILLTDKKRINVDAYARYRIIDPLKFFQAARTEAVLRDRFGKIINSAIRQEIAKNSLGDLLSGKRLSIMQDIQSKVSSEAPTFGIDIIDVRIGRTDLPPDTSQAVYNRMRTEREREARELRAEGAEEALKIRARADRERIVILAEAQRTSEILRGEGEGQRNLILGEAFSRDPAFFDFYKSLAEYEENLVDSETTMVLTPDSDFFRYFGSASGSSQ